MKLNRPTLLRTAGAAAAAAALAGGLAFAAVPAHASTGFSQNLEVCDFLSTKNGVVAIDVWDGSRFIVKVNEGKCVTRTFTDQHLGDTVQIFLDNKGIEIADLTFLNKGLIVDSVTGTPTSHVVQGVLVNP